MSSSKLSSIIQSSDLFGHIIRLNFNQQGVSHRTLIGGIFSFLIKLLMSFYVYYNFKKMLLYEDDKQYND